MRCRSCSITPPFPLCSETTARSRSHRGFPRPTGIPPAPFPFLRSGCGSRDPVFLDLSRWVRVPGTSPLPSPPFLSRTTDAHLPLQRRAGLVLIQESGSWDFFASRKGRAFLGVVQNRERGFPEGRLDFRVLPRPLPLWVREEGRDPPP